MESPSAFSREKKPATARHAKPSTQTQVFDSFKYNL
jgi:hypothetical protein